MNVYLIIEQLLLFSTFMMSAHDYNTCGKKQELCSNQDDNLLAKMEENIHNNMNSKFVDLKNDIIIKRLQDENQQLQEKCKKLQEKVINVESDVNSLNQYGRRNNIVFTGIPDSVNDEDLESTVTSILKDIDEAVDSSDIEDCHHFGKSNSKLK